MRGLEAMLIGIALLATALLATAPAAAQSLSPMRAAGATPSAVKGFRLKVGNPYPRPMRFAVVPMTPDLTREAAKAQALPDTVVLGPGAVRPVIVAFKIDPAKKERTIGVCIIPQNLAGSILPRVCGTYRGTMVTLPGQ